jgi:hypothetical protein
LSTTLLCTIHGATVEKKIEDDNVTNTFRAFNPTQVFLHFKKNIVIDPLQSASQFASYYIIT